MGMFTKGQQRAAENVYETLRQYLKPKDGGVHVVMVNSFSKLGNQSFGCEDKYTTQIDYILHCMQIDGYIILDVKFNSCLLYTSGLRLTVPLKLLYLTC